jgi:hypothetical protein
MNPLPIGYRRLLRAVPAIAWAGVIFGLSSLPGSSLPGGYSVQGHLAEYAILGVLVLLALADSGPAGRAALIALIACSAYGITDEFHQSFVPGRTPDVLDWAADTVGAAIGVSAGLAWLRWRALSNKR